MSVVECNNKDHHLLLLPGVAASPPLPGEHPVGLLQYDGVHLLPPVNLRPTLTCTEILLEILRNIRNMKVILWE